MNADRTKVRTCRACACMACQLGHRPPRGTVHFGRHHAATAHRGRATGEGFIVPDQHFVPQAMAGDAQVPDGDAEFAQHIVEPSQIPAQVVRRVAHVRILTAHLGLCERDSRFAL